MPLYDYQLFEYWTNLERKLAGKPLNLGGIIGSGPGGGPPGGFIGQLPQSRVTYDTAEAELSGFVSNNPYNSSGVLVSASLLDNLNHIRYRIKQLETGGTGTSHVDIYENDTLIASDVTVIDFQGTAVNVTNIGGGEAEVLIDNTFIDLDDTPATYAGQGNKVVTVKGAEDGVEFITLSGGVDTFKAKVSANDTTEDFLESKVVAGDGITVTVLNDGANEQLRVTAVVSGLPAFPDMEAGMTFGIWSELNSIETGRGKVLARADGTITYISSTLETASVSGNVVIDINKNGTSIFDPGNRITILEGQTDDFDRIPDTTSFSRNDKFTMDIDVVGSGAAYLTVEITWIEV